MKIISFDVNLLTNPLYNTEIFNMKITFFSISRKDCFKVEYKIIYETAKIVQRLADKISYLRSIYNSAVNLYKWKTTFSYLTFLWYNEKDKKRLLNFYLQLYFILILLTLSFMYKNLMADVSIHVYTTKIFEVQIIGKFYVNIFISEINIT